MGNDGVKCTLSRGNFPLPRDFCPLFQNCQVEYFAVNNLEKEQ